MGVYKFPQQFSRGGISKRQGDLSRAVGTAHDIHLVLNGTGPRQSRPLTVLLGMVHPRANEIEQ